MPKNPEGTGDGPPTGTEGDDHLKGGAGADTLDGLGGDDPLWGEAGRDQLVGGLGDDTAWGGGGDDLVIGDMRVPFRPPPFDPGAGRDILRGGCGDDRVEGVGGKDWLWGDAGDDSLDGEDGDDRLRGSEGDDWLHGGFGADLLLGGEGQDTSAFGTYGGSLTSTVVADTGVGEGARDTILGFAQGEDVIDLSALNYVSLRVGPPYDLVFEFIGTDPFTAGGGGGPQLRYEERQGRTIVQMDGSYVRSPERQVDGVVDAEIGLAGVYELGTADFVL